MILKKECYDCAHLRFDREDNYRCAVEVCTYAAHAEAALTCEDCPGSLSDEPCEGQCGRALPPAKGTAPEVAPPEEPRHRDCTTCSYAASPRWCALDLCPWGLRRPQDREALDYCAPADAPPPPEGVTVTGVRYYYADREVVRIRVGAEALDGYQAPSPKPTLMQGLALYHIALGFQELAEAMEEV